MRHTSPCWRRTAKALSCLTLSLCLLALTACSGGGGENTITVYSVTSQPVDTSRQLPAAVTAEPTALPAPTYESADYEDDDDIAWELSGEETPEPLLESRATPVPQTADAVIGYVARESSAIAPYECTERDLASLNMLMFESVVELDNEGKPTPLLADRWTVELTDEGQSMWTFELREGIQFHNGETLTSVDVINSYTAISAAEGTSLYYERTKLIDHMEYVTDTVFRVYCRRPGWMLLYAMTFPVIQSNTIYTATPRGTGPFWLISYEPGIRMRLEANPLWWKRAGSIRSINAINYANSASALTALNSGAVDMLASRSYAASQSRNLSNMMSMDYTTSTYEMLVPNLSSASLLSDLQLRRAIMYAIDRNGVQSNGYLSMLQSSEVPVVPGTWLYETQSAMYYYSPERALQILYDAGWSDSNGDGVLDRVRDGLLQELSFTIYTYSEDSVPVRLNAAKEIAKNLTAIGFRVDVVSGTKADMRKLLNSKQFDLALVGINLSAVPNPTVIVDSEGNANVSGYVDMTMDSLCDAIYTAADDVMLKSVFSDIQMKIVNDLPILGLGYHTGAVISRLSLNGLSGIREFDVWNGLENTVLQ